MDEWRGVYKMDDVKKRTVKLSLSEKTKIRDEKNFIRDVKEFCAELIRKRKKETHQEACKRHDENYLKD